MRFLIALLLALLLFNTSFGQTKPPKDSISRDCILSDYSLSISGNDGLCGPGSGYAVVSLTGSGTIPTQLNQSVLYMWLKNEGSKADLVNIHDSKLTSDTVYHLTAGKYSVVVNAGLGCSLTTDVEINESGEPLGELPTCNVEVSDDQSTLTAYPEGQKDYEWYKDGKRLRNTNTSKIKASGAGVYTVLITHINGCTSKCEAEVAKSCIDSDLKVYLRGKHGTCQDSTTQLKAYVRGGNEPFIYTWSLISFMNGEKDIIRESTNRTDELSNIPAGIYKVVITDANGCTADATEEIIVIEQSEPCQILVSEDTTKLYIDAQSDSYVKWYFNNEPIKQNSATAIEIKENGQYSVKIYNRSGCITECSIDIERSEPPSNNDGTCDYKEVLSSDFGQNIGVWNDGGSDAARVRSNYFKKGYCIRLRDNSGIRSSIFTNPIDLSAAKGLKVNFEFLAQGMERNEGFILEYSPNGGNNFFMIDEWREGKGDNSFENRQIVKVSNEYRIGDLSENVIIRLRADASNNGDRVYIDNIHISACHIEEGTDQTDDADTLPDDEVETDADTDMDSEDPSPSAEDCFDRVISDENFDANIGIWIDGGSDMARVKDKVHFNSHVIRLRDNSKRRSSMYTRVIDLEGAHTLRLDFSYITEGFSEGERFLFEYSADGGSSFVTLEEWKMGTDGFSNKEMYNVEKVYELPLTVEKVVLRMRADGSSNRDKVYIDNLKIHTCGAVSPLMDAPAKEGKSIDTESTDEEEIVLTIAVEEDIDLKFNAYPNPAIDMIKIDWEEASTQERKVEILNMYGRSMTKMTIDAYEKGMTIDISNYPTGIYFIQMRQGDQISETKRIIKQ